MKKEDLVSFFIALVILVLVGRSLFNPFPTYAIPEITDYKEETINSISISIKTCLIVGNTMIEEEYLLDDIEEVSPIYLGEWTITAYCSCSECCGKWANNRTIIVGAEGTPLVSGYSCASNELSFGTTLYIDGYGEVKVQDRTANFINEKYNGQIIDIYFSNHDDAVKFAKKSLNVWQKEL